MNAAALTPAQVAVGLVVETCVPRIVDRQGPQPPIQPKPIRPEDRVKLRLPEGGDTLAYEVAEIPVLLDLAGSGATVFFIGGDCEAGAALLDAAVQRDFPMLKKTRDEAHPRGGRVRFRVYEGFLNEKRHCKLEVDFPDSGANERERVFAVRIAAGERADAQTAQAQPQQAPQPPPRQAASPPAPEPPPEPGNKKKKGWF